MGAFKPKWVNSILNIFDVNSLRLGGLFFLYIWLAIDLFKITEKLIHDQLNKWIKMPPTLLLSRMQFLHMIINRRGFIEKRPFKHCIWIKQNNSKYK